MPNSDLQELNEMLIYYNIEQHSQSENHLDFSLVSVPVEKHINSIIILERQHNDVVDHSKVLLAL